MSCFTYMQTIIKMSKERLSCKVAAGLFFIYTHSIIRILLVYLAERFEKCIFAASGNSRFYDKITVIQIDSIISFCKENDNLISFLVDVIGVLVSRITIIYEILHRRKR